MAVKLNARGEVADCVTVSQFYPGKTEFACGFYSAGTIRYAGEPGKGPTGSPSDVEAWADAQYLKEYGEDGANQIGGVSIDDEHRLMTAALPSSEGSHYLDLHIDPSTSQINDLAQISGALLSGYPIVATVTEASIYDVELKRNPYWWGAGGTHVVVITGVTNDGHLLVHDSANVAGSLQGANTPNPGPRTYDVSRIDITWASMARMPWLAPFPDNWNAATGERLNQIVQTPATNQFTDFNASVVQQWTLFEHQTGVLSRTTGIFKAWRDQWIAGRFRGQPLSPEQQDIGRPGVVFQAFNGCTCFWINGQAIWM